MIYRIVNMQYKNLETVDLVTVHSLVSNDVLSVLSGAFGYKYVE